MKQLITYFLLAYLISWTIWLPLYGTVFGLNNLPILPYHHGLGAFGPMIAAFITTWYFKKQIGMSMLLKRCYNYKSLTYLIVALLSPFLLVVVAAIINYLVDDTPMQLNALISSKEFPQFNIISFFLYNLVFFGFGEEVGWRGFALPLFQSKFNALVSSILLTLFWAIWHWPLFFYRPGFTSMDFSSIIGWFFSLLTGSVLLTWLYNSSKASILICAIFHSTIDIAFTADFENKNIINYTGFLITLWGILTIIYFKPKNLSKSERSKSDLIA